MKFFRKSFRIFFETLSSFSIFHLSYWRWIRLGILAVNDVILTIVSLYLSFFLRFDTFSLENFEGIFYHSCFVFSIVHVFVFLLFGMYRQVWRHANFSSAWLIGRLLFMATLLSTSFIMRESNLLPRSIPLIYFLLSLIFHLIEKFTWRALCSFKSSIEGGEKEKCFIYGAGQAGELLMRHMKLSANFPYKAVGFIDDDINKKNRVINGVKIIGHGSQLKDIARQYHISIVLIAIHDLSGKKLREIVASCHDAKLKPFIVPNLALSLSEEIQKPRPVNVQDLLRRSPKSVQKDVIHDFFSSHVVLVTGAGGSIGSEICRQILETKPKQLILIEASEFNLYQIQRELMENAIHIPLIGIMGSVSDKNLVEHVFCTYKPEYVLHAAAYKHVPLVEANPITAIMNNIQGTSYVAEACLKHGAKNFLLVSTDKAVHPTNTMGKTKRVCEILIQSLHQIYGTKCRFSAVRFGNVLGSSGSVIPLFLEQIEKGGPVTVTDPHMTRYFMLISEAVGLVLQSIIKTQGGEIFVLDMGEPVQIYEMAKELIKLAGKEKDVEIIFTGLRPGEKIFEELIIDGAEKHELHEDIYVARPENFSGEKALSMIEELLSFGRQFETEKAIQILNHLAANSLHQN